MDLYPISEENQQLLEELRELISEAIKKGDHDAELLQRFVFFLPFFCCCFLPACRDKVFMRLFLVKRTSGSCRKTICSATLKVMIMMGEFPAS
jgi:hypothetical protein